MSDLKVHMMHAEVSAALERLSKLFKPGMKISFIARLPGNGEADVLIGDDHDADELIALVRRRFGSSTVSAPEEVRDAALEEAANLCENWYVKGTQMHQTMYEFAKRFRMMKRTTSGKGEAA